MQRCRRAVAEKSNQVIRGLDRPKYKERVKQPNRNMLAKHRVWREGQPDGQTHKKIIQWTERFVEEA